MCIIVIITTIILPALYFGMGQSSVVHILREIRIMMSKSIFQIYL